MRSPDHLLFELVVLGLIVCSVSVLNYPRGIKNRLSPCNSALSFHQCSKDLLCSSACLKSKLSNKQDVLIISNLLATNTFMW